jgi:hypothetical protein
MPSTVAIEAEFERALDQYEAHLMKALCEHFGVYTARAAVRGRAQGRDSALGAGEEAETEE